MARPAFLRDLADTDGFGSTAADASTLRDTLLFGHHIEVPVYSGDPLTLRISAQIYVGMSDIECLADTIDSL